MEKLPSSLEALASTLARLSDTQLLAEVDRAAAHGREVTADLVALLAECDERQLYAKEGYASLFEFCVGRLRLSESQAYHRIQAARAARRFPLVLDRLRNGQVTLTAVALLREHLTEANHREVLEWAEGRRKREVEVFIRGVDPKPDVPSSLRRLAVPLALAPATAADASAGCPTSAAPAALARRMEAMPVVPRAQAVVRPLAPARYSLHVTISQETHDKLRRAQDLLRHAGAAEPAVVLDRALTLLVAQLERRKAGAPQPSQKPATAGPTRKAKPTRPVSTPLAQGPQAAEVEHIQQLGARPRHIPAAVRRAVWDRDGARCAYVSPSGTRCGATARLEFHHRVPFAEGGASTVENVALVCALHNKVEAARWFDFDQAESDTGPLGCPRARPRGRAGG